MTAADKQPDPVARSNTDEHLDEARARARSVLSGEAHLGAVDDWRYALATARDAALLIWLAFVMLAGADMPEAWPSLLVAFSLGLALLLGLSAGRATLTQVQYHVTELERERAEIRDHFDHERDEVVALYAAKGLEEPLLGQVVDTLCADDDRLLKVMMEEELGLSMHHVNHPLVVGMWNAAAALTAALWIALPPVWLGHAIGRWWVPLAGTILLGALSIATARASSRGVAGIFASGVLMALVAGGTVHYLTRWLAETTWPLATP